jgi:hypothetical protein
MIPDKSDTPFPFFLVVPSHYDEAQEPTGKRYVSLASKFIHNGPFSSHFPPNLGQS